VLNSQQLRSAVVPTVRSFRIQADDDHAGEIVITILQTRGPRTRRFFPASVDGFLQYPVGTLRYVTSRDAGNQPAKRCCWPLQAPASFSGRRGTSHAGRLSCTARYCLLDASMLLSSPSSAWQPTAAAATTDNRLESAACGTTNCRSALKPRFHWPRSIRLLEQRPQWLESMALANRRRFTCIIITKIIITKSV